MLFIIKGTETKACIFSCMTESNNFNWLKFIQQKSCYPGISISSLILPEGFNYDFFSDNLEETVLKALLKPSKVKNSLSIF